MNMYTMLIVFLYISCGLQLTGSQVAVVIKQPDLNAKIAAYGNAQKVVHAQMRAPLQVIRRGDISYAHPIHKMALTSKKTIALFGKDNFCCIKVEKQELLNIGGGAIGNLYACSGDSVVMTSGGKAGFFNIEECPTSNNSMWVARLKRVDHLGKGTLCCAATTATSMATAWADGTVQIDDTSFKYKHHPRQLALYDKRLAVQGSFEDAHGKMCSKISLYEYENAWQEKLSIDIPDDACQMHLQGDHLLIHHVVGKRLESWSRNVHGTWKRKNNVKIDCLVALDENYLVLCSASTITLYQFINDAWHHVAFCQGNYFEHGIENPQCIAFKDGRLVVAGVKKAVVYDMQQPENGAKK
jgi:hypothetical protein